MAEVFRRDPHGTAISIPASTNLNTFTAAGRYIQLTNGNATLALNYPLASQAGLLEVIPFESATTMIQRFTVRDTGIIYVRYFNSTTWTSWNTYTAPAPPAAYVPPTGTVQLWAGLKTSPPTGWLLCDGSAVSRTTYAALYAVIFGEYGDGNGTTTFNLPNMTGRFVRGVVSLPGNNGGADTHTHGLTTAVADFRIVENSTNFQARIRTSPESRAMDKTLVSAATIGPATVVSTAGVALTGSTDSASNVPSYLDMSYIIKI